MENIEQVTSELIITSSLEDLRNAGEQLRKAKWVLFATDLLDGNLDKECPQTAVKVKTFSNHLNKFREARAFFVAPSSSLTMCCDATGLDTQAVRDRLAPEMLLEFNTMLADKAVTDFMTYRRNYVNKRKDD
jgi:hypothetical protein